MKKLLLRVSLALILTFMPYTVYAYSEQILLGGENVGIHIDSKGILIIGFYKVNGELNRGNPTIEIGDVILKVNEKNVTSINELTTAIEETMKDNQVLLTVQREGKEIPVKLDLSYIDGVYKTGLYVKDGISGLGTISYIDPQTRIFGALGHEIIESNTNKRIEVKSGNIFDSDISKIIPSENGKVGEKNAKLNYSLVYGNITKNTMYGIFGKYTADLPKGKLFEVGKPGDIKEGKASIYTVLSNNQITEYEINITKINQNSDIKNITFEITDEKLLKEAGGVIQGMSGSPIVQDGKIIGAVTHAIVDNVTNGYGIFITKMLEEGEK